MLESENKCCKLGMGGIYLSCALTLWLKQRQKCNIIHQSLRGHYISLIIILIEA